MHFLVRTLVLVAIAATLGRNELLAQPERNPPPAPDSAAVPWTDLKPLPRAHAHNDYLHAKPLTEAIQFGFCSVEADVFLRGDELLVAHTVLELRRERTLRRLYLEPLRSWIRDHDGQIFPDGTGIWLLVDIKSEAEATYQQVHAQLEEYSDIVSQYRDGKFLQKQVTVVISGNRPVNRIRQQTTRYAGIDGRPEDLEHPIPAHLIPWISTDWKSHFRWRGVGEMPVEEQKKLEQLVSASKRQGCLLRFWGAPDNSAVWTQLWNSEVDLLGTDRLAGMAAFQNGQLLLPTPQPEPRRNP